MTEEEMIITVAQEGETPHQPLLATTGAPLEALAAKAKAAALVAHKAKRRPTNNYSDIKVAVKVRVEIKGRTKIRVKVRVNAKVKAKIRIDQ